MTNIQMNMDKFENLFNRLLRKPSLASYEMDYVSTYSACKHNKEMVFQAYDRYIEANLKARKAEYQFHQNL